MFLLCSPARAAALLGDRFDRSRLRPCFPAIRCNGLGDFEEAVK
jgi:hypothetical protein